MDDFGGCDGCGSFRCLDLFGAALLCPVCSGLEPREREREAEEEDGDEDALLAHPEEQA